MKKLIPLFLLLCMAIVAFPQEKAEDASYKNEISVDATALLQRFLFISTYPYPVYPVSDNLFNVMYRRHINDWGIRAGIGWSYQQYNQTENYDKPLVNMYSSLHINIGIERKVDFGKRWQFLYGLDLVSQNTHIINEDEMYSGGRYKTEQIRDEYGFAPFCGLRFKINKRMSVYTESSMMVNSFTDIYRTEYISTPANNTTQKSSGMEATFYTPMNVFFSFHF